MTNRTEFVDEQERTLVEAAMALAKNWKFNSWTTWAHVAALQKALAAYTPKFLDYSKPMPTWDEFIRSKAGVERDGILMGGNFVLEKDYNAIRDAIAEGTE